MIRLQVARRDDLSTWRYGISTQALWAIVSGQRYRHLLEAPAQADLLV